MVLSVSSLGIWRIPAVFYGMRYAIEKQEIFKALFSKGDYYADVPGIGLVHCIDLASGYQLSPNWERAIRKEITGLREGLFVDVGANMGFYSILAAKNGNRVIAVEPGRKAFGCLWDTVWLNNLDIELVNAAAWSCDMMLKLAIPGHSDIATVSDHGEQVQGLTLDTILAGRKPDLIKIDVEGSEPEVLKGMPNTLAHRPRIIFEALSESKNQACRKILLDSGYSRIDRLDSTNHIAVC